MCGLSKKKPVIGIVGGIGSGKSTVADELAALGCLLIDADEIGHALLSEPQVLRQLRRRWGEGIFDSHRKVDRHSLGEIVFADASELSALNGILHPLIRSRIEEWITEAYRRKDVVAVVLDAAVLFEAGWDDLCTHLIFVASSPRRRLERVRLQRGWDEENWKVRENFQNSLDKKQEMCDYTIDNSSSESHLAEQTLKLFKRIIDASNCS